MYHVVNRMPNECGAVAVVKIGRRNRGTGRKPAPVPLCSSQIAQGDLGSNPGKAK
jgi:hypothetical protein